MKNLQIATTGSNYAFWELFRYGEDGHIFEIYDSPNNQLIGDRFVMKQEDSGLIMTRFGTQGIVTPFAGITGATFKRVEQFKPVSIGEAMDEIKEDKRNVFVQDKNGHFERVTVWTGLDEIEVQDFQDLLNRNFFIKK